LINIVITQTDYQSVKSFIWAGEDEGSLGLELDSDDWDVIGKSEIE